MKFSKYLLLLLTFVGVALVSSCSKDDDDNDQWTDYQKTHAALSYEGSYVVYPRDSFHQYHTDRAYASIIFSWNTTANATQYKADTTCYITYFVSTDDSITEDMLNREIDEEAAAFSAPNNYNAVGEQGQYYMAGLEKNVTTLTYTPTYSIVGSPYYGEPTKMMLFYMINPNTGHAFRIIAQGRAATTTFWNHVDDILATFKFQ